jgi:shikimate kinase
VEKKDNIVFIGMPGAGKSTLGVVLAKIVNYRFLDCDLVIQETYGQTLEQIIDERGPAGFIAAENDVLKQIDAERTIIATGGSAVYSDEAMQHLKRIGTMVYLRVSFDEMKRRLGDLDERGVVLRDRKVTSLQVLYDDRVPLYEKYADLTIDVSCGSFRDTALRLRDMLVENSCI